MTTTESNNSDSNDVPDICANCGKGEEGSDSLKACTACKLVKYCNRECQIAHRPQHKKACRKRAAELHDELLFKQPPPQYGDCQICFLRLPSLHSGSMYMSCCGKVICNGCICAPIYDHEGNVVAEKSCPFCRTPMPATNEEVVERIKKRVKAGGVESICTMAGYYDNGIYGLPQNHTKALELWHQAADLGSAKAYCNVGNAYDNGEGVEVDKNKSRHYYELSAMGGCVTGRYNLGCIEARAGNMDRASKHFMIAVTGGDNASLERIKWLYTNGHATKEDYSKALRAYQVYLKEIKSDQRDKAATAHETFKYIE